MEQIPRGRQGAAGRHWKWPKFCQFHKCVYLHCAQTKVLCGCINGLHHAGLVLPQALGRKSIKYLVSVCTGRERSKD